MNRLAEVIEIYTGSDGNRTTALYGELGRLGPIGVVAVNLFRAQKASERAKVYRGGSNIRQAYDRKQWSIDQVCGALVAGAGVLRWGWGVDEQQPVHRHVLYVDLPTGQVSFHGSHRGQGPDYPDAWDGKRGVSPDRICRWVAQLLGGAAA